MCRSLSRDLYDVAHHHLVALLPQDAGGHLHQDHGEGDPAFLCPFHPVSVCHMPQPNSRSEFRFSLFLYAIS